MSTPIGWPEAQRICDIPEVREALDKFAEDSREENMLAMVSAIMGYAVPQGRAAGLEEAAKICEKLGDEYDMKESHKWPELKSDAYAGCQDCESAIRALITSPTPSDAGKDDARDADMVLMPRQLTARNGAKAALAGEFSETVERNCATCHFEEHDDDCPECDGKGTWTQTVPVSWENIKRIYEKAVEHLGKPVALSSLEVIGKGEKG